MHGNGYWRVKVGAIWAKIVSWAYDVRTRRRWGWFCQLADHYTRDRGAVGAASHGAALHVEADRAFEGRVLEVLLQDIVIVDWQADGGLTGVKRVPGASRDCEKPDYCRDDNRYGQVSVFHLRPQSEPKLIFGQALSAIVV